MIALLSSKTRRELTPYALARGTDAYGMVNAGAAASKEAKDSAFHHWEKGHWPVLSQFSNTGREI